eukprot:gnl/TRDRNA2_/TRDRNA2_208348_c0_seq1.p1 gnl/TRDRNA2_/TRDRNA2_208348_c0~~gnl/TRDRNA2_/TRDRNA2_208348_c0_seq1.p1  ORF type:complete len:136 (-),score=6.59 gnl/TRDRNA2_/TRDRNA2_208348_c0_seq1:53-460(-)
MIESMQLLHSLHRESYVRHAGVEAVAQVPEHVDQSTIALVAAHVEHEKSSDARCSAVEARAKLETIALPFRLLQLQTFVVHVKNALGGMTMVCVRSFRYSSTLIWLLLASVSQRGRKHGSSERCNSSFSKWHESI